MQMIVEMLLRHGADTEVAGRAYGTTSLVAAAQHGHGEVVQLLLDGRANPNRQLNDGSTALDKALEAGHSDVAAILRRVVETLPRAPVRLPDSETEAWTEL